MFNFTFEAELKRVALEALERALASVVSRSLMAQAGCVVDTRVSYSPDTGEFEARCEIRVRHPA